MFQRHKDHAPGPLGPAATGLAPAPCPAPALPSAAPSPAARDAAMPARAPAVDQAPAPPKLLIVGAGISLAGEITACDRLMVQGTAQVTLHRTRAIEIAETGRFTGGRAEVEEAVIAGRYEGELTVRGRLLIRATGQVAGTVRYGELEVGRGGRLAGTVAEREGEAQADAAGGQGLSGNVAPLVLPRSASLEAERRQDASAVVGGPSEGG